MRFDTGAARVKREDGVEIGHFKMDLSVRDLSWKVDEDFAWNVGAGGRTR